MDTGLLMIALLVVGILLAIYGYQRSRRFSEQIFKDVRYFGIALIVSSIGISIGQTQGWL